MFVPGDLITDKGTPQFGTRALVIAVSHTDCGFYTVSWLLRSGRIETFRNRAEAWYIKNFVVICSCQEA